MPGLISPRRRRTFIKEMGERKEHGGGVTVRERWRIREGMSGRAGRTEISDACLTSLTAAELSYR